LRFGGLRHHQYYDHVNNVCMAHFPDENSWICFDSEQVRIEKLRYAKNEKLGGIVVGELHNDVAPNSEECVLKVASRFMA
jgi:GH18 family chitinase